MWKRLLAAGALAAGLMSGQDDMGGMGGRGGGGGGRGGDMGGGGGMMPRPQSKADQFVDKLKLNREQQEQTQKILSAALERLGAVRMDLDARRAKIAGAFIDGKSADEVKALTAEYAGASAQLMQIEADAFAQVCALLKPNQQSKADQAFEILTSLFAQAGGGRGGRGGMGRGRGAGR